MNKENKEIVRGICKYQNFTSKDEIKEVIQAVHDSDASDDIIIDCNGVEIRVIHIDSIDEIWEDSLRNLLEDCYEIPEHLQNYIDYDKWVEDCKIDGKGHHFSGYDGSEYETDNYYYFRTN